MRVVIADDMMLLRRGVVDVLVGEGIDVVGEASDASGLLRTVEATAPDVAIIDIRMPPSHRSRAFPVRLPRACFSSGGMTASSLAIRAWSAADSGNA